MVIHRIMFLLFYTICSVCIVVFERAIGIPVLFLLVVPIFFWSQRVVERTIFYIFCTILLATVFATPLYIATVCICFAVSLYGFRFTFLGNFLAAIVQSVVYLGLSVLFVVVTTTQMSVVATFYLLVVWIVVSLVRLRKDIQTNGMTLRNSRLIVLK